MSEEEEPIDLLDFSLPNIAEGWTTTEVGVVAERLQYGTSQKAGSTEAKGVPVLRMGNIQRARIDTAGLKYVSKDQLREFRLARGDVLFNRTNSPELVGKAAVYDQKNDMVFASYLIRVSPTGAIEPRFLSWWINSPWGRTWARLVRNDGVSQSNINGTKLAKMPLPLAPLAEQRRIAAKIAALLQRVDRAKARVDRARDLIKRFKQAAIAAACSGSLTEEWRQSRNNNSSPRSIEDLEARRRSLWESRNEARERAKKYTPPFLVDAPEHLELPDGWTWTTVSQLSFMDVGFAFKSAEFTNAGVRLLRGENVEPGSLRWNETRCWPEKKLEEYRHLLVEPGELILAMDRPIISTGLKLARAKASDLPALLVQRVMRFKMADVRDTEFLNYCLLDSRFVDFLAHDGMTGSDVPHITGTGVAEFPVPLPPADERDEIVRRLRGLLEFAAKIERRVSRASIAVDRLPQTILARAFSGELVPTEAELARVEGRSYEPSLAMLERIQAEHDEPEQSRQRRLRKRTSRKAAQA